MTLGELIRIGEGELSAFSPTPRLDAELLLMHVTGFPRWKLLAESRAPPDPNLELQFKELLHRRKLYEPVAYITGEREFWGIPFKVSPAVLIPRPERELVVSLALNALGIGDASSARSSEREKTKIRIADLGTGSGCLAISLARELANREIEAELIAIDISVDALEVARANADRHGVSELVRFVEGNWFHVPGDLGGPFALIVANPPYVGPAENVSPDTRFEPSSALWSDDDGLSDVKRIISQARVHLRPEGALICEVGAGKRTMLVPWLECSAAGWSWELHGDDTPEDRFTVVTLHKLGTK